LKPWMFLGRIEVFETEGTERVLERLSGAGIQDIVIGDLFFGKSPAFSPNLSLYRDTKVRPPEMPKSLESKARYLFEAIREAKQRGFRLYLHDWGQNLSSGYMPPAITRQVSLIPGALLTDCFNDPEALKYFDARTKDAYEHFPEIDGFILDGPEWGYELDHSKWNGIFKCFCQSCRAKAEELGYDFEAIREAASRLLERLHGLNPEEVRLLIEAQRGILDALDSALAEPGILEWLSFRTDCITDYVRHAHETIKGIDKRLSLAIGPRLPAFAPLTGYNMRRLSGFTDFQAPKLYFWLHGIDGLKGTIYRYVETLTRWNPRLPETLALELFQTFFGLRIPGLKSLEDLYKPLPEAFFKETVPREIGKMVHRIGSLEKIRPWVGLHHGGVRMTGEELKALLEAMKASGLESFIYWHYGDLTEEEWHLLKVIAGR